MTSSDDDDELRAEVWRRRRAGETIRAIAEEMGLSKSRVGRMAADDDEIGVEYADDDDDSDLDPAEVARLNAMDSGQPVTPPVRYCGVGPVITKQAGWDAPQIALEWRYRDAADRSPSEMDIYRYVQSLETSGRWAEAEAFQADLDRQYAADPELRRVEDLGNAHHYEYIGEQSDAIDGRYWIAPLT